MTTRRMSVRRNLKKKEGERENECGVVAFRPVDRYLFKLFLNREAERGLTLGVVDSGRA